MKDACERHGATVALTALDLRDYAAVRTTLRDTFAERPVDMAVLNAGISSGLPPWGGQEPAEDACRTMEVDATAAINMAATLLECMTKRGSGHLVFISSIAGLYPLPGSPSYSAAKVALAYYARALQLGQRGGGVRVSLVCPGYIASPMSARLVGPQPLRLSADQAAARIMDSLAAGKDRIIFPLLLALGARLLHCMPMPLAAFFLRWFSFTVDPDEESPLKGGAPKTGNNDK